MSIQTQIQSMMLAKAVDSMINENARADALAAIKRDPDYKKNWIKVMKEQLQLMLVPLNLILLLNCVRFSILVLVQLRLLIKEHEDERR